jgi:hypothetical protein
MWWKRILAQPFVIDLAAICKIGERWSAVFRDQLVVMSDQ